MKINQGSNNKIILASASPRRKELLEAIGIEFVVRPSQVEEFMYPEESPERQVQRLAAEKAADIAKKYAGSWVLGADTIVVIDGRILGKPSDRAEAESMLSTLSGRTHNVFTGYSIMNLSFPGSNIVGFSRSEVMIRKLSHDEIQGYVDTGEPMDKAGAYAIQGVGAAIVEKVCGSYTNVVGLPLCEVARDLKKLGIFDFLVGSAK
ncbi:MAG: Maf family protein [Pseudomonadota bacterium]